LWNSKRDLHIYNGADNSTQQLEEEEEEEEPQNINIHILKRCHFA